jgi:hypothetical protein
MLIFLSLVMGFGGFHFADATVYDQKIGALRVGIHVVLDDAGKVVWVTDEEPASAGGKQIKGAVLLPHLADFYSLVQERGLGFDVDLDPAVQGRMSRYLRAAGIFKVRDPIFPPGGLEEEYWRETEVLAQRGYLEVKGGPSVHFSIVVDPDRPDDPLDLPPEGPVTFWWNDMGSGDPVVWRDHPLLVKDLIARFRASGRKVGANIQDARPDDVAALSRFSFDFYEGLPAEGVDVDLFPSRLVWVPLAGLNDKRYCAKQLEQRLGRAKNLALYPMDDIAVVQDSLETIGYRLAERCGVWKKRRDKALAPLEAWLQKGGLVGVGSGGGHLFSFTAELAFELQTLERLGADQEQLLRAFFETTPGLLGDAKPYLKVGSPANFIVYKDDRYWGRLI